MTRLITPPLIGETQPPEYVAYDEIALREPRLLVPGKAPLGPVSLDKKSATAYGLCGGFFCLSSSPGFPRDIYGNPLALHLDSELPDYSISHDRNGAFAVIDTQSVGIDAYLVNAKSSGVSTRSFSCLFSVYASDIVGVFIRSRTPDTNTILGWRNGGQFDMRIASTDYTAAGTWNAGEWVDIAICSGSVSALLYKDSSLLINGGVGGAGTVNTFCVGDDPAGGGSQHTFSMRYCLVFDRQLSALDVAAIHRDPYQFLIPA